jgi:hypothetical protein
MKTAQTKYQAIIFITSTGLRDAGWKKQESNKNEYGRIQSTAK